MATHRQLNDAERREVRERFLTLSAKGYGWQELTQACGEHGGFARKGVEADFRFYRINQLKSLRDHMRDIPVTDEAREAGVKTLQPEDLVRARPTTKVGGNMVFAFADEVEEGDMTWEDYVRMYRVSLPTEHPGADLLSAATWQLERAVEKCDVPFLKKALEVQLVRLAAARDRIDEIVFEVLEEVES